MNSSVGSFLSHKNINYFITCTVQWNLVNTDTKGIIWNSACIIQVSVLSGLFLEKLYEMFQCWDKWDCPLCMGICIKRVALEQVSIVELWKHAEAVSGPYCDNTASHTFKRLLNRHLISIKCPEGTNETEYIVSLAARANEIQHRAWKLQYYNTLPFIEK